MKLPARAALLMTLALCCFLRGAAGDEAKPARHADEREGDAQLIHRADVLKDRGAPGNERHLWPLIATPEARMSYFEVTGRSGMHFHPDADHRLYVLEGTVLVITGARTNTAIPGDLVVIPRGVRHCYDVPAKGGRALLLTFDAPPYDPRKTVSVETASRSEPAPK